MLNQSEFHIFEFSTNLKSSASLLRYFSYTRPLAAMVTNNTPKTKRTEKTNEQTMTQDKDLIFAQRTFFCFSATVQVAHLVLPDTQRQRFAKPKEPLFANASTKFQTNC